MNWHRYTLAAVLVATGALMLGITAFGTSEEPGAMPPVLALRSGYASEGNFAGFEACSLTLSLEQTADGWKGWLMPDPNVLSFNRYGQPMLTTLMAGESVPVTLRLLATSEETGRKCYEVSQDRFAETMHLVFPRHAGGTYRLMIENKAGGKRIVLLEADDANTYIASVRSGR
jgi:hypothetical protein